MSTRSTLASIAALMGAVFVDMLGYLMVLPLLPFYAERLGAGPFEVGILVAAFAFAQVVTAPVWGRLSDRIGRRPVILAGLLTSAAAYLLFGLAETLFVLLASRLVQGGGGGINGVIQAYVSDTVPRDERTKALGWLTAATSAGVMVGPALGSLATTISVAAPGLIASALCVVNVFAAWRWLPESKSEREAAERRPVFGALGAIVRRPLAPAHLMIWIYSCGMMAFMAMNGVLALYLERVFGVTEQSIGYFYVYVGAVSLLMRSLALGPLVSRLGELRVLQLGAVVLGLGQLLIPVPGSVIAVGLVIGLVPIGTSMLFPATTSQVSQHAPDEEVGQTLGLQQTVGGLARMTGPIWAGAVFEQLGIAVPFWLAAGLMGIAALAAVFLVTWEDPTLAEEESGVEAAKGLTT